MRMEQGTRWTRIGALRRRVHELRLPLAVPVSGEHNS